LAQFTNLIENVANLVAIYQMEIHDANGQLITIIDNSTAAPPRHVVPVENIGQRPRGIRIKASLPNGQGPIEFVGGGNTRTNYVHPDAWDKYVPNVPCNDQRKVECNLSRNSAGLKEPLQCDEVYHAHGSSQNWKQLKPCKIPFSISIDVV
jgi:hypothetical protein